MKEQDIQTLKQDIYQAYTNVLASAWKISMQLKLQQVWHRKLMIIQKEI